MLIGSIKGGCSVKSYLSILQGRTSKVVASIKSKEFDELEEAFKQFLNESSRGITPSTPIYYTTNRLKIIGIGIIIVVIIVGVIYSTNAKVTNILNKQDIPDWQILQTKRLK